MFLSIKAISKISDVACTQSLPAATNFEGLFIGGGIWQIEQSTLRLQLRFVQVPVPDA